MGNLAFNFESASTTALVERLQGCDQDFEWYPTSDAMLGDIQTDMRDYFRVDKDRAITSSVLDCGAGDGRALLSLTQGDRYAIEKARPHLDRLDRSIFVVGTDFHGQTLLDKRVDAIFCNPPYSEFDQWTLKLIQEANASVVYLVVPDRWERDQRLQDALAARKAQATVVTESDFGDGPRQARARVQILRIDLACAGRWNRGEPKVDPFELWFEQNFPLKLGEQSRSEYEIERAERERVSRSVAGSSELVAKRGLVAVLEQFYQQELAKLVEHYQRLCEMDPELLRELEVNLKGVKSALKLKITSLKDAYWRELFDNLSTLTDRLTSESRRRMLDTLMSHTHVDFSAENAHAVVTWAVKNVNHYLDDQLVSLVETMVNKANVRQYRSNERTFGEEMWRYGRRPEGLHCYQLEYRIVLANVGGICNSPWSFDQTASGLEGRAERFLNDVCTVATNIGFSTFGRGGAQSEQWHSGRKVVFHYDDTMTGEPRVLMEAKAHKNGNLHIKFDQRFMQRLNVEFGRLKGWVKSAGEAAEEMDIDPAVAAAAFDCNHKIEPGEAMAKLTGPCSQNESDDEH